MTTNTIEARARRIADYLFENGSGDIATRLVLAQDRTSGGYKELGGWCKQSIIDIITAEMAGADVNIELLAKRIAARAFRMRSNQEIVEAAAIEELATVGLNDVTVECRDSYKGPAWNPKVIEAPAEETTATIEPITTEELAEWRAKLDRLTLQQGELAQLGPVERPYENTINDLIGDSRRLIDEVEAGRRDTEKFKQFESENYDLRSQLHEAELTVQVITDQLHGGASSNQTGNQVRR